MYRPHAQTVYGFGNMGQSCRSIQLEKCVLQGLPSIMFCDPQQVGSQLSTLKWEDLLVKGLPGSGYTLARFQVQPAAGAT